VVGKPTTLFYFLCLRGENMELEGKIAIVTGATSGIGKAIVGRFLQEGSTIAAIGRNQEALDGLKHTFPDLPLHLFTADLSSESERTHCFHRIIGELQGVDILVHGAGTIGVGNIETTTLEAWDAMMNINLRAIFHLTQLAVPMLIERKGNIVSISSVTGTRAFPGVLAYCVCKAGLDQFTRCVSLELASRGVRVNAVNPGVVVTQLHRRGGMTEQQYESFLQHSTQTHPMGRVGTPEEIAELVFFLASPKASWITGVTYNIDGGRANTCAR